MTHKIVCTGDELGAVLFALDMVETVSINARRTQAGQYIVEWETKGDEGQNNTGISEPS